MRADSRMVVRVVAVAWLAVALTARAVDAQPEAACNPCLALKDSGLAVRGEDVLARYSPELARGEWGRVAERLAADFRDSKLVPDVTERTALQTQLDAVAKEMLEVEKSADASTLYSRAQGVRQARFTLDAGDEVGQAVIFQGTAAEIMIDCSSLTLEARRDLCERVFDAQRLLIKYGASGRQRALNELNRCVSLWDNFNENGYSMMPWELAVNGWWAFKPGSLTPPGWQLVVAHPALALELGRPASTVRRLEVGTLEPLGVLVYRRDRSSYFGASALVSVPSGEDIGFGGMLHMGKTVKAGYVWRAKGEHSGAVLSADLYQLIAKAPELLRDARARIVAARDSLASAR